MKTGTRTANRAVTVLSAVVVMVMAGAGGAEAGPSGHRNCGFTSSSATQRQLTDTGYRARVVVTTSRQCGQGRAKIVAVTYGAWGAAG